jgi:hypothetical protein
MSMTTGKRIKYVKLKNWKIVCFERLANSKKRETVEVYGSNYII